RSLPGVGAGAVARGRRRGAGSGTGLDPVGVGMGDQDKGRPLFLGPHENRELELMLAGKKHLSSFSFEEGIEREIFPERQFDSHVAEGFLVKDVRVERWVSAGGEEINMRSVLYATAS